MSHCRKIRGEMAAALYEPLDAADREAFEQHLAACSDCAAEYERLRAMTDAAVVAPVSFGGDVLPAVRERLREGGGVGSRLWGWQKLLAPAVFAVVCMFSVSVYVAQDRGADQAAPTGVTSAERILQEARRMAEADPSGALALLQEGRDAASSAETAGALQLAIANMEFDVFHRYSDSFEAYKRLQQDYTDAWTYSDPAIKERFDLLTEAREEGFEALYQIDNARRQGEAGMPILERVMARYPGRVVAREALNTMLALVEGEGVSALEQVKERCTDPVAVAQLDVHLGERYWRERLDPARGREMLRRVAGGQYEVPAKMAKEVLAKLESGE